jgi:hypothetical protein
MTLKPLTLDDYFKLIIKPTQKETTMFDKTKMFFTEQIEKLNSLLTKPTAFVEEEQEDEDFWCFLARTSAYDDIAAKETFISGAQDGTWIEVVDQVLDVLSHHYGYDIKEQVYYSVAFPLNEKGYAGYGRSLNDEVLQQLLLAHPEVYESQMFGKPTKDLFA